jgi:hypothetical protein
VTLEEGTANIAQTAADANVVLPPDFPDFYPQQQPPERAGDDSQFVSPLTTAPPHSFLAPAFDESAATGTANMPFAHMSMDDMDIDMDMDLDAGTEPVEQRMSAFARLKFCDGSYYMHTYQIILGRNIDLAHKDMLRLHKAEQYRMAGNEKKAQAILRGTRRRKEHARSHARSVISEKGGIVNAPISSLPIEYQQLRQSEPSQSVSSSSRRPSQSGSSGQAEESVEHAPQDVLMQAFPTVPTNLEHVVVEDPNDTPLVPIHPQHITEARGHRGPKAISRHHAKIFYNFDEGRFDLEVLSQNGLFHQEDFYGQGQVIPLRHGDHITIGMVEITFLLPDIALTDGEGTRQSSSRPMSFSFENGGGESEEMSETSGSDRKSVNPHHLFYRPDVDDSDPLDHDEDDEFDSSPRAQPQQINRKVKLKLKNNPPPPQPPARKEVKKKHVPENPPPKHSTKQPKPRPKEASKEPAKEKGKTAAKELPKEKPKEKPEATKTIKEEEPKKPDSDVKEKKAEPLAEGTVLTHEVVVKLGLPENMVGTTVEKRKGPGRPPKDGLMSKRQKSQMIREFKEAEKARRLGLDPSDLPAPPTKAKPPRPRKDSNLGEEGDDDIRESTEGKGEGAEQSGEKKIAKPVRPPRSPSPEMKESDYTEEQLQRPTANYVVLIHEAISSSKTGAMNLQQIYSAIERKYPYYKFRTTTNGWQSSVRHNLGQHDAFKKADKEGKGYNWVIDPNVSIEKERRKRVTPPPPSQAQRQQYYHPHQYPHPQGPPGQFYPSYYPPQAAPMNGPVNPGGQDAPVLRLPPSLARSAPANAPTAPSPAHASPYASPWAGGATAQNAAPPPTRPYPPSAAPPVPNGTGGHSTGQYGMLVATPSAPYQPYAGAGTSYSPYATPGPSHSNASHPPNSQPNAPPPQTATVPPSQRAPVAPMGVPNKTLPKQPFPWPPHVGPELVPQLAAFRETFVGSFPNDPDSAELKVDNALRHVIARPSDPQVTISDDERSIVAIIWQKIPGINSLRNGISVGDGVQKVVAGPPVTAGETKPPPAPTPVQKASSTSPPASTTAATIAASDAAKAAATSVTEPSHPSASAPNLPHPPSHSRPPASLQTFQVTAPSTVLHPPPAAHTPTTNGHPNPIPTSTPLPSPSTATTFQRPIVEPFTPPVPGSPNPGVTVNGTEPSLSQAPNLASGTKRAFAEIGRSPSATAAADTGGGAEKALTPEAKKIKTEGT